MSFSRLCVYLRRWLPIIMLLLLALPAFAQQPGPSTDAAAEKPAYSTLADLLENDQSRERLIEELRTLAAQQNGDPSNAAAVPANENRAQQVSLARRLAVATSDIAGEIGGQLKNLGTAVTALLTPTESEALANFDLNELTRAALNMGLVIVATFVLFFLLRRLARPLFERTSRWPSTGGERSTLLRTIVAVGLAALVDVAVVALAYLGGSLLATFAIGASGELSTRASLFLNAFLIIELVKAVLRLLFSPRYDGLRLMAIDGDQARHWNRWLAILTGIVGYGMLVAVPLVNTYLSAALGRAAGLVIMLLAFVYATTFVLRNRTRLRDALERKADNASLGASRLALKLLARSWHLLAIAYFLVVLLLSVTRPETALPSVMLATLKTLVIIGVGLLLSAVLTQLIGKRIVLSEEWRTKLPKLEARLNAYIPSFLKVIRILILIGVVMLVLDVWNVFDLRAWYATEGGYSLVNKLLDVLIILAVAGALWIVLASLIEHRLNDTGRGEPSARARTLLSLFRNALAITLITMTGMIVLAEIGINIGPLIAGAGVLGLAIGFGAQKLVQDIITGVFIQVENAMNTGDVVTAGGITGTAERLSIRSVGIRDLSGTYHIVPFSSVDTVSNYMRGFANHVGEYSIAYRENIDHAIEQLQAAFDELKESDEHRAQILAPLTVAGVTALADSSVNIRVVIKTTPGDQWAVGRAYNRLVKIHFDAAGIEIPYPHTTLYFGADKNGAAPPANLRLLDERPPRRAQAHGRPHGEESSHSLGDASHAKPDEADVDTPDER